MDYLHALAIIATGLVAGFVNTVAGGGSLLSLPILIFLGLPPATANATNRVAIFSQSVFGIAGFKSKGVSAFRYSLFLGISALLGAVIGAEVAVRMDGRMFNKILAVIMVMVVLLTVFKKKNAGEAKAGDFSKKRQALGAVVFFFVGIYGGFLQAGVGFVIIAALTALHGFSLVKTNSIKVFVILIYTSAALAVFVWEGQVNWIYGILLAIGNSAGAWFASRWSVEKGDKIIERILLVAVIALAVKLWFFN